MSVYERYNEQQKVPQENLPQSIKLAYRPFFEQLSCDNEDNTCVITALNMLFQNRYYDEPIFSLKDVNKTTKEPGISISNLKTFFKSRNITFNFDEVYLYLQGEKVLNFLFKKSEKVLGFIINLAGYGKTSGTNHAVSCFTDHEGNLVILEHGFAFVVEKKNLMKAINDIYGTGLGFLENDYTYDIHSIFTLFFDENDIVVEKKAAVKEVAKKHEAVKKCPEGETWDPKEKKCRKKKKPGPKKTTH